MTVTAKINNIDNVLNDLTKSQCNDGQVIAFQSLNPAGWITPLVSFENVALVKAPIHMKPA